MTDINENIAALVKAYNHNNSATLPNTITSIDEAELIQDALISECNIQSKIWKLGASTKAAQNSLKLSQAFSAPIPTEKCLNDQATIQLDKLKFKGFECEIAIILPQGIDTNIQVITKENLLEAKPLISAAFELPETRFDKLPPSQGGLALVADNGAAGWALLSDKYKRISPDIDNEQVVLYKDGLKIMTGDTSQYSFSCIDLVIDHLNRIKKRGYNIDAGHTMLLGSLTPLYIIDEPCTIRADFSSLGSIEINIYGT